MTWTAKPGERIQVVRIGRRTALFAEIETGSCGLNSNGVSRRARREWRPRTMKIHGIVTLKALSDLKLW